MESIEETTKSMSSKNGFINHVFNFDDDTKCELMNITQYGILSVIPVIGLNKTVQKIIPDVDEDKGSLEILAEVIVQIVVMFLGMFFIHRLVTFVPTYSQMKYEDYSVPNIIIAFLIIVLSLQTKLGEKTTMWTRLVVQWWIPYDFDLYPKLPQCFPVNRRVFVFV